ncbi:MAG: RsmB/NOP family class I SAM-dependent RNA methyltransferase [Flavobacteriales bacterium]|nr:RsmB/NOP family class I SAM-dependent RNA methyltransferase [Flavobacteriales bacterium]
MAKRRPAKKKRPDKGAVALPKAFVARMHATLGERDSALFCDALDALPPCSVRANPAHQHVPNGERVPWCEHGRYLDQRPVFTLDPFFHAGAYYVQEASSMMVEQAFKATDLAEKEILALDLCAAPGGKSGHLRNLLHSSSLLISNEMIPARATILAQNLWKQGAENTLITQQRATFFGRWQERFDLVLLDAPCSGEGLMRKDHFARQQWSPRLVTQCASVQRELLEEAWKALRPGGFLLYSTCTWSAEENGDQIASFCERENAEVVAVPVQPSWRIRTGSFGLHCYPHESRGEGFFLSLLRKPGDHGKHPRAAKASDTDLLERGGILYSLSRQWQRIAAELWEADGRSISGLPIAVSEEDGWTPHPAAAYSAKPRGFWPRSCPSTSWTLTRSKH